MKDNTVKQALGTGGMSFGTMVSSSTTGFARSGLRRSRVRLLRHGAHGLEHGDDPHAHGDVARGAKLVPLVRVPADDHDYIARCSISARSASWCRWSRARSRPGTSCLAPVTRRQAHGRASVLGRLRERQPRRHDGEGEPRDHGHRADRDEGRRRGGRSDRRGRRRRCPDWALRPHELARHPRTVHQYRSTRTPSARAGAAAANGKAVGIMAGTPEDAVRHMALGFRAISFSDMGIYEDRPALRAAGSTEGRRPGRQELEAPFAPRVEERREHWWPW